MSRRLLAAARRWIPLNTRRALMRYSRWPPIGRVRFGHLRRTEPIGRDFGSVRGQPVDRYYIERFLAERQSDVRGAVLEIGADTYTRRYGGDRVRRSDVLHVAERRQGVTIIGDLTRPETFVADQYDCVILTQTLPFIFDTTAALRTVHRILRPGGVVLATVPGISQISRYDMDRWGHYWAFTTRSAARLFEEAFASTQVLVESHGNVLAAVAMLHGLSCDDLREEELVQVDPDYQVLITVRAVKSPDAP